MEVQLFQESVSERNFVMLQYKARKKGTLRFLLLLFPSLRQGLKCFQMVNLKITHHLFPTIDQEGKRTAFSCIPCENSTKETEKSKTAQFVHFFFLGYINRSDLKSEKDNLTCYTAKRDILIW